MMGYGARTGSAVGRHDPLFARALYLAGGSDLLIVACDVCLLAPTQAEALGVRIAARTGVPADRIAVTSTHTHSGPETGLVAALAGREPPAHVPALEQAIVDAGCEAVRSAAPARLGFGRSEAKIGINRRRADGPLDREVLVLRVDGADGAPRAVVWMHGCHPTALGHDNLHYSADWPGAAHALLAERV